MKPQNSVIIITYNQEKLISRAIESVLCQKEFIYEIIISDDCSTDNTWAVIESYRKAFPDLIKPYRNFMNIGIFAHIERIWKYPKGDMIYLLAGDDEFCKELFFIANKTIDENKIDFLNKAITIYFDYKSVRPSGKEKVIRNNLVTEFDPISLKIRKLISNRTTCISRKVLDKFRSTNEIGIFTDGLMDIQTQIHSEKNYYVPYIGSIYYKDIGIGSRTGRIEGLKSFLLLTKEYMKINDSWSREDLFWLKYLEKRTEFQINPTFSRYFNLLYFYYKIKLVKYSLNFFLRETVFLIILFPHCFKLNKS